MNDSERKKRFRNALSNYTGVLKIVDDMCEKTPTDLVEVFPDDWRDDPLILHGVYLQYLDLTEEEKVYWRYQTVRVIEEYGPEYIWQNRARLAAEIDFIRNF